MALAGWNERAPLSLAQVERRDRPAGRRQGKDVLHVRDLPGRGRAADRRGDAVRARPASTAAPRSASSSARWTSGARATAPMPSTRIVDFGFAELRLERIWLEVGTENAASPALVREGRLHSRGDAPTRSLGRRPLHRAATSCRSCATNGRAAAPDRARAEPRAARPAAAARTRLAGHPGGALRGWAASRTSTRPNAYIGLWSCLAGFRRDDLTRRLRAMPRSSRARSCAARSTPCARTDYRPLTSAPSRASAARVGRAGRPRLRRDLEPSAALARVASRPGRRTDEAPGTGRACWRDEHPADALLDRHRPGDPAGSAIGHLGAAPRRPVRARRRRHRPGRRRCRRPSRCPPSSSATSAAFGPASVARHRGVPGDERLAG